MGLAFAKKLPNYSFPWNIILIYIKKKIEDAMKHISYGNPDKQNLIY